MSDLAVLAFTPSAALCLHLYESRINLYDRFRFLMPTEKARVDTNSVVTFRLPLSLWCTTMLAGENGSNASPKRFLIMLGWNANKF